MNLDIYTLSGSDVPYRLPSFSNSIALNNHMFEVEGEAYEYVDGKYFRRVSKLKQGSSFGEIALQRKCMRTATVKTEEDCTFAYLTKSNFEDSLLSISLEVEQSRVTFLQSIPIFKGITRNKILSFYWNFGVVKCIRGQVIFSEASPVKFVYIVFKGKFTLLKKLAHEDKRKQAYLQVEKGREKPKVENVLTEKFPDLKDFPFS